MTDRTIEFVDFQSDHAPMAYDWTEDDSLTPEELRERVAALPKAEVTTVPPASASWNVVEFDNEGPAEVTDAEVTTSAPGSIYVSEQELATA